MSSSFETRIVKLERLRPSATDSGFAASPLSKIQAFVDAEGGRLAGESWLAATARLHDMTSSGLISYLRCRAAGART